MRKLIPTLTLITTLALTSLCDAGARARKTPPLLTPFESLCYEYGLWAKSTAGARDRGASYLQLLTILRRNFRERPDTVFEAAMTETLQAIFGVSA